MTCQREDAALDAVMGERFRNQFDKLFRTADLKKVDALQKRARQVAADSAVLANRVAEFERGLCKVEQTIARIELNRPAVERAAAGFERILAVVNSSRIVTPDGLLKAATRGPFFLN